jgi:hypothetical protein
MQPSSRAAFMIAILTVAPVFSAAAARGEQLVPLPVAPREQLLLLPTPEEVSLSIQQIPRGSRCTWGNTSIYWRPGELQLPSQVEAFRRFTVATSPMGSMFISGPPQFALFGWDRCPQ